MLVVSFKFFCYDTYGLCICLHICVVVIVYKHGQFLRHVLNSQDVHLNKCFVAKYSLDDINKFHCIVHTSFISLGI
jgi:hypothetical protein